MKVSVQMDEPMLRAAKERAADLGISMSEYVRRLIRRDLPETRKEKADISDDFGIGHSGGPNVSRVNDGSTAEAIEADRRRKTGRR